MKRVRFEEKKLKINKKIEVKMEKKKVPFFFGIKVSEEFFECV